MAANAQRYSVAAIVLHWAIAIAILGMIPLGWWMTDALEDRNTQAQAIAAFQLHKSIGLTVLALSVVRLAWRLINPAPALPDGMAPWERFAAKATHVAFYVVMIAIPLTGWLYVSTGWSADDNRPLEVPTVFFGLFQVPHLLGLSGLADDARAAAATVLEFVHSKLAWVAIGLSVLHVAAALKHQFINKDGVLGRMVPGVPDGVAAPTSPARGAALGAGLLAVAIAVGASVWAFTSPPMSAPVAAERVEDSSPLPSETHATTEVASDEPAATTEEPAAAPDPALWQVQRNASSIVFTGEHAGVAFEGRFGAWRADIRFDPNNLQASSAVVTIQTASASDGVPVHDNALPQAEWFDAANHPNAVFRTSSIRARGDGVYEARGALTIKGRPIELRLPFTLRINGDRAIMDGTAQIRRDEADLGMSSDPEAEYVSREIGVRVHVEAVRAQ